MGSTVSDRWDGVENWFRKLHVFIRQTHRVVGALWLLSVPLYAVSDVGGALPGPSLPLLSLVGLILTGGYLLLRPWVRGAATASDRLKRLKERNVTLPVFVRRTHRIVAALWVVLLAVGLAFEPESPLVVVPFVVSLLYISITGGYMLLRPWVNRIRTR